MAVHWGGRGPGHLSRGIRFRYPPAGTPSLVLDFVADANDPWSTLSMNFAAEFFSVDEGDPTVGGERINLQVWS